MYVIGQNHIPPDGPAMSIMSRVPFINKYSGEIVASENFPAILGARCHKINRRINPNAPEPSQMLVHCVVVAAGGDLGNLRFSYANGRGRRPWLQD